jgi:hypothetical protein
VLYACDISPCQEQAEIVKKDLAAIGLRVQVKTFLRDTLFAREATPGERFDLAWASPRRSAARTFGLYGMGPRRAVRQAHARVSWNERGI